VNHSYNILIGDKTDMKILQKEFHLKEKRRGFHLVTNEILSNLNEISTIKIGSINLLLKHTSASLSLNENCDSSVRTDMENFVNDVISNKPYFEHTYEGDDDMLSLFNVKPDSSYKSL